MKIILGITGASGAIYAQRILEKLSKIDSIEVSMVMTKDAKTVWEYELQNTDYLKVKAKNYDIHDFFSPMASGSASFDGMIVCPCSMGSMGKIAHGIADNLLTRAADVMLKEKKKLILVVRETPYNLIHLENMTKLAQAGATILPATPSFYSKPINITDLIDTVIDRALQNFGVPVDSYKWGE
ncbi:MAG: UbiX family flavin prenyltransferase [Bacteroidales bacterium]|nr:UbiX family flavin prenyltransferase [Bacteroidales bacterium]MDY0216285.1 UbiX family flavin prenyltransferase [Bacteroidales bacterium]